MPIRLVIIDGDTLTRYGLRELAARHTDIDVTGECGTAAQAPGMIAALMPDVVTVDVALPDGDGLRLARELRDRRPGLGIVMLTSQGEDDVLFRALETGASAFVSKTAPVDEVLAAIRHAAVAASSFTAAGLASALARRHAAEEGLALSPRERETLQLLRDGRSIPAIAQELFISHSTAKTYVARLYRKLGAANRTQALMTAMHFGLIHYENHRSPAGAGDPRHAAAGHPAARPVAAHLTAGAIPAMHLTSLELPSARPAGDRRDRHGWRDQAGGVTVSAPGAFRRCPGVSAVRRQGPRGACHADPPGRR